MNGKLMCQVLHLIKIKIVKCPLHSTEVNKIKIIQEGLEVVNLTLAIIVEKRVINRENVQTKRDNHLGAGKEI
jgi:hypothetical protein